MAAEKMTRRERLNRCYFHEETDRPAVYSRRGFPSDDPTCARLIETLDARTEIKRGWFGTAYETPLPIQARTEPHTEDFERRIELLRTPKGDLQHATFISLTGQPNLDETFFIKNADDIETFLSLPMPEFGGDTSSFEKLDAEVGDAGIATVFIGNNPAGITAKLCGSENFALLSVTARDRLHALCERHLRIHLERLKFLLARGVGPYFSMLGEEYLVPPLHGPKDFHEFNVRYDKPIIDMIHDAGGRVHVHSHGAIKRVFDGFLEMGADVLHPFEGPPQGDILPREAKQFARGRMCLEGNIQIHRMYEATPEEIREETEQLIADVWDDRKGLIVSPTASPYIRGQGESCLPQYQAMIETVLNAAGA